MRKIAENDKSLQIPPFLKHQLQSDNGLPSNQLLTRA